MMQERMREEMLARTEERIRRTRADRSLQKQQINQSSMLDLIHNSFINAATTTQDRDTATTATQDEVAMLRREVKFLADQLREERSIFSSR
jgi:hypothetical protein